MLSNGREKVWNKDSVNKRLQDLANRSDTGSDGEEGTDSQTKSNRRAFIGRMSRQTAEESRQNYGDPLQK